MWFIGLSASELLIGIAVRCLIIFGILPIHEYAHARMAYALGDDTASLKGRMTLNPLAHVDWVGAACIMLIGFGWAKPVPVNPYRFTDRTHKKRSMALTALAGPLSNLIVALIGMIIFRLVCSFESVGFVSIGGELFYVKESALIVWYAFSTLVTINISLAVFNLIPVPPLDGSKILAAFVPDNILYKISEFTNKYRMVITIAFVVLIYSNLLDKPLAWLNNAVFDGIFKGADWLFNLIGLEVGSIG